MRAAPSSMEYSVWTWRWTNESEPFGVLVVPRVEVVAGGLVAFGEDIAAILGRPGDTARRVGAVSPTRSCASPTSSVRMPRHAAWCARFPTI